MINVYRKENCNVHKLKKKIGLYAHKHITWKFNNDKAWLESVHCPQKTRKRLISKLEWKKFKSILRRLD